MNGPGKPKAVQIRGFTYPIETVGHTRKHPVVLSANGTISPRRKLS